MGFFLYIAAGDRSMRFGIRLIFVSVPCLAWSIFASAQARVPLTPLPLEHAPVVTQAPPYFGLSDTQCDGSDTVYAHYITRGGNSFSFSSGVTKIAEDGTSEDIPMAKLPGGAPAHVFQFAVADDGSLHEVVRAQDPDDPKAAPRIYYVTFDADGTFHSMEPFAHEFVPSLLLPLPNGDFFAAGVVLRDENGNVVEKPLAAIFGPDAQIRRTLHRGNDPSSKPERPQWDGDPYALSGIAVLGSDGNIYLLHDDDHQSKVKVLSQAGLLQRELSLSHPLGVGVGDGMWVSGSRILVSYEGKADKAQHRHIYALYDAQTGATLRLYHPDFSGILACFDEGQTLTVLLRQKTTNAVEIGEAELR